MRSERPENDHQKTSPEKRPNQITTEGVTFSEVKRFPLGNNLFLGMYQNALSAGLKIRPGASVNVFIVNKDGKPVFDFGKYAPLVESDWAQFSGIRDLTTGDPLCIKVGFERLVHDPREIMSLLHEIGHLEVAKTLDPKERRWRDAARIQFRAVAGKYDEQAPPGTGETVLQDERDAWAHGIRIARQLKHVHGADLFGFFKTPDEFFTWIRLSGLRSYELALQKRGHHTISGNARIQKWKKNNPDQYKTLLGDAQVRKAEEFDEMLTKARELEHREFAQYIKENYPDLYMEVTNIGTDQL